MLFSVGTAVNFASIQASKRLSLQGLERFLFLIPFRDCFAPKMALKNVHKVQIFQ